MQVAIDSATPLDDTGPGGGFMDAPVEPYGGYGGPMRNYGRLYGSLDFDDVSIIWILSLSLYRHAVSFYLASMGRGMRFLHDSNF